MQGSLAHKLRVLRAERGLTLREAAALTGVAKETISDIERGLRHPHDPTLAKIAKGYDVPVEELLEEPVLAGTPGKVEAPRGAGQAQTSTRTAEDFERKMAHVLEPVRTETLRDVQAITRLIESGGIPQHSGREAAEAEARKRFSDAFSGEERVEAFGELVYGYALLERVTELTQEALRERDEKIAKLEAKIERLERVSEAEQESMHR
jgi:transcriptional regulator with XRE-family HTH domain